MNKLLKWWKKRQLRRAIHELEISVMFFEIPYDIAKGRLDMLENQLNELENEQTRTEDI